MTRKWFALLLLVSLFLSLLAACGGEDAPLPDDNGNTDKPSADSGDKNEDKDKDEAESLRFTPLAVKNELALTSVTQRSFYPVYAELVSGLTALRQNADTVFSDASLLRGYLSGLLSASYDLGIFADYIGHTSVSYGDTVYGATDGEYAIGGGEGYPAASGRFVTATDDNSLKEALQNAIAGDVICIPAETVIDMSDFLLAGDTVGFTATSGKIEYKMTIPEGVTLMGERGTDGCGGGMIKISSYMKDAGIVLEKNARLTGLVIQGPDTLDDADNIVENHSVGILIEGDGAVIDNCEISGFFKQAIQIVGAKDVSIHHNYIHHVMGQSGIAFLIRNATVHAGDNLFSRVTTAASLFMDTSSLTFENNVFVRPEDSPFFIVNSYKSYDETYKKARVGTDTLTVRNNTFLAGGDLIDASALCKKLTVENNLFAYAADIYDDGLLLVNGVDASVYDNERFAIRGNAFDILAPKVCSKTKDGLVDAGVTLTAYQPTESKMPETNLGKTAPVVLSNIYYDSNYDTPFATMRSLLAFADKDIVGVMKVEINNVLSDLCNYSNYLKFSDEGKITQTVDGVVYGPQADELGGIGGGIGYHQIYTEKDADHIVRTKNELLSAVKAAKAGEVIYIPEGVIIDISNAEKNKVDTLSLENSITLCSNRGYVHEDGTVSTGGGIKSTALSGSALINVLADDVRLTGLVVQGPDPATHLAHNTRCGKLPSELVSKYYWQLTVTRGVYVTADNVEIDNCEFAGFTNCAIALRQAETIKAEDGTESYVSSRGSLVHHNYIHHNQISGLGYGVSHDYSYSKVYCNMFNYNRHSIAATGVPESGYDAYNNIEMGASLGHYFDMHGGRDRGDGTDIGGEYMRMYNNAFLGEYNPYYLRGVPVDEITFNQNVVYYGSKAYGGVLTRNHGGTGEKLSNVKIGKNIWNIANGKGTVVTGAD